MQAAKEKVSDIAASAKAGLQKTKAVVDEKRKKLMSHDSISKETATRKKEERIDEAERQKQMAFEENAAARHGTSWAGGPTTPVAGTQGGVTRRHGHSITPRDQLNQDPNAT